MKLGNVMNRIAGAALEAVPLLSASVSLAGQVVLEKGPLSRIREGG